MAQLAVKKDSRTIRTTRDAEGTHIDLLLDRLDPFGIVSEGETIRLSVLPDGQIRGYTGPVAYEPCGAPIQFYPKKRLARSRFGGGEAPLYSTLRTLYYPWEDFALLDDPAFADRLAALKEQFGGELSPREEKASPGPARMMVREGRLSLAAVNLHNAVWRRALPLADERRLRAARACHGGRRLYNALVRHPRLFELVETSRVAGFLIQHLMPAADDAADLFVEQVCLEKGASLKTVLLRLLNGVIRFRHGIGDLDPYDYLQQLVAGPDPYRPMREGLFLDLSPAFVRWAKDERLSPRTTGRIESNDLLTMIRRVVEHQSAYDPNHMASLGHADHRRFFIEVAIAAADSHHAAAALQNPDAALRAFYRHYEREGIKRVNQENVCRLLGQIRDAERNVRQDTKRYSFSRLCRLNEEWHAQQRRVRREQAIKKAEERLQHFPEPPFRKAALGEFSLVWLGDNVELAIEGAELQHCVGGYDYSCLRGNCVIYGVRREEARVATLELEPSGAIRQLQSYRNQKPPKEIEAAVVQILKVAWPEEARPWTPELDEAQIEKFDDDLPF